MHVIYRANQAEHGIYILVVAPQEYVNTYSTRRLPIHAHPLVYFSVRDASASNRTPPSVSCARPPLV